MNIKSIIAALGMVCAAAAFADADGELSYLYWQVNLDKGNPYSVPGFSYATVKGVGDDSYLFCYDDKGNKLADSDRLYANAYEDVGDTGNVLSPVYSGFDAAKHANSYIFELWQEDADGNSSRVGWATYGYKQLADYIYTTRSTSGDKALMIAAVPEPTSAVLLLLGLAGLALRRRKAKVALAAAAACSLQFGAFAAADNLIYSFQPSADDTYADGTRVLAGERYALVWLAEGSDGVEIAADGSVVDAAKGEIVRVRKSLGNGEKFTFQVDAAVKDALVEKGGSWAVYLLDTRVYGANGSVTVAEVADGQVASVNAAKRLAESVVETREVPAGMSDTRVTAAASATDVTAVPVGAPKPEIVGIEVVDGKARIKVRNTVPYLQYNVASGDQLAEISGKKAEVPLNGAAGEDIELVVPANSGSAFFQVQRN